jgi:hypothetical protein
VYAVKGCWISRDLPIDADNIQSISKLLKILIFESGGRDQVIGTV